MNLTSAKEILDNLVLNGENFHEINLKHKLSRIQPEHLMVLNAFYEIDKKNNTLSTSGTLTSFTDVNFFDIKERVNLDNDIIETCYSDLLRDGLIIMTHQSMLYHYITKLGIKLIDYILCDLTNEKV